VLLLVKTWKEWWEESNTTLSITYYIMCFIKWWSAQKTSLICCCCCSISCKLLKVHWFDLVTAACEGWHRHYTLLKRLSKFCPQSGIISMTTLSMMIDLLNKMPIKLAILLDIFLGLVLFPWMTKGKVFPALQFPNWFFFGLTWILAPQADFRKLFL
jgi:hypothetical protein